MRGERGIETTSKSERVKLGKKGARGDGGINFDREASITREIMRRKKISREGENG